MNIEDDVSPWGRTTTLEETYCYAPGQLAIWQVVAPEIVGGPDVLVEVPVIVVAVEFHKWSPPQTTYLYTGQWRTGEPGGMIQAKCILHRYTRDVTEKDVKSILEGLGISDGVYEDHALRGHLISESDIFWFDVESGCKVYPFQFGEQPPLISPEDHLI